MILSNFIPILSAFFGSGMTETWFYPMLALSVVATVPCIVRAFTR